VKAVDGVSIGYQVFGEGPYDLVLNDGWMGNLDANWDLDDFARLLRVWAQRARVITFDRRGFGISDRPGTPGQMAIEKSLDDMRAVMDAAGSERAVVYGFEAGAAVSLLFAASYPGTRHVARPARAARSLLALIRLPVGLDTGRGE